MRRQEFNINCASPDYEDWMIISEKTKGSLLLNKNVYQYNWVWIEDFSDHITPEEKPLSLPEDNLIRGLDLSSEHKWDISMTTANVALNFYTYSVVQRTLIVNAAGISLS